METMNYTMQNTTDQQQQLNYQFNLLNLLYSSLLQNSNDTRVIDSPVQWNSNSFNDSHLSFDNDFNQNNQFDQNVQQLHFSPVDQFIPQYQLNQQIQMQDQIIPQQINQQPQQPQQIQNPKINQRNSQSDNAILYSNHRNYQVFQQSILISLLNKFADITIKRERKRSNVTLPFFTISTVTFNNNDSFDLDSYVQKRCVEIKEYDLNHNINMKTATRRFKTNRITEVLHTLIDLLRINDEEIETVRTRYKEGIKQSETMIKCKMNDKEINEKEIKIYGNVVNNYIKERMINDEIYFQKGELYNLLVDFIVNDSNN